MNCILGFREAKRAMMRTGLTAMLVVCSVAMAFAQTVSNVSVNPASVVGGVNAIGTVTISAKAGVDGVNVTLAALSDFATVPQSVSVPKGKTSATFTITTSPVPTDTNVTVSGTVGQTTKSATLTLKAPKITSLALSPTQLVGGNNSNGTVKISSPAPGSGLTINLASNQAAAMVDSTVVIGAGATSGKFTITTTGVSSNTTAKITASLNSSSIGVSLTINPPVISKLSLSPTALVGGNPAIGTVTLSGAAPPNGLTIKLGATGAAASVPASLFLESGTTSGTFNVTTTAVKTKSTSTISAKFGSSNATAALTINPAPANKYAGTYSGSFLSTSGDIGSIDIVVSATGAMSGGSTDGLSGTKATLTGTIDNSGNATVTVTDNSGTHSNTGTFVSLSGGNIQGAFPNGNSGTTYVTLNLANKPLMYQGTYSGTFDDGQGSSGSVTMTISASGQVNGSYTQNGNGNGGNGTVKGTVSANGAAKLTVKNSTGSNTKSASAAFGQGGSPLNIVVLNSGSATNTTLTLTKQ